MLQILYKLDILVLALRMLDLYRKCTHKDDTEMAKRRKETLKSRTTCV